MLASTSSALQTDKNSVLGRTIKHGHWLIKVHNVIITWIELRGRRDRDRDRMVVGCTATNTYAISTYHH